MEHAGARYLPYCTGVVGFLHDFDHEDVDGTYHLGTLRQLHKTLVEQERDQVVKQILEDVDTGFLGQQLTHEHLEGTADVSAKAFDTLYLCQGFQQVSN